MHVATTDLHDFCRRNLFFSLCFLLITLRLIMENSGGNIVILRRLFVPEKRILALIICFLVVFLVGIISFIIANRVPETNSIPSERKRYVETFLPYPYVPIESSINFSVDPCIDFYEFSCGGWSNYATKISDEDYITSYMILEKFVKQRVKSIFQAAISGDQHPRLVNRAINFYQTCIGATDVKHKKNEEALLQLLVDIGGLPLLNRNFSQGDSFQWVKACTIIVKNLGIDKIMSAQIGIDETNRSKHIFVIKAPKLEAAYEYNHETITTALYCVIQDLQVVDFNAEIFYSHVDAMLSIQYKIIKLAEYFHGNASEPRRMTITELQEEIPGIDWLHFFQMLSKEVLNCRNNCFDDNEPVLVLDIPYLKAVIQFLNSQAIENNEALNNLFCWYVISEVLPILPSAFQKYSDLMDYTHEEHMEAIATGCYAKVESLFSAALSYLYIHHSHSVDKENIVDLLGYMKNSFNQIIEANSWLDKETKSKVLRKMEVMKEVIGFSHTFQSKQIFDQGDDDFPVLTDNCVRNIILISNFFFSQSLIRLNTVRLDNHYESSRPATYVGAYYALNFNTFVLPLAICNKPFYYENGPQYLNYGVLGFIVGHEMNHGFDTSGRKRNENGSASTWWTEDAVSMHDNQMKCFENQFKTYFDSDNLTSGANSVKTLNENAADSTGLEQAYLAYKSWGKNHGIEPRYKGLEQFSPDQMFFIAFASKHCIKISTEKRALLAAVDPHSPANLRVRGSVSNSEAFAKAFQCKPGSPMNPLKKCKIW